MTESTVLRLAVCLFPEVDALDFTGPMDLFSFLFPQNRPLLEQFGITSVPYAIKVTYLSISKDPVVASTGATFLPDAAYEDVSEQFDMLLVPGGFGTRPEACPQSVAAFIKEQSPGAKYVLSVCTGAEVLARAGVLTGKRATTNKASFKRIVAETAEYGVDWVIKARWVVDGKFWVSSGVAAGTDMAYAFLTQLVGTEIATKVRGVAELNIKEQGDDEYAEFWGLV